jgi:hypothetical protein
MAIYLRRCPLLGIGFLEPLPHTGRRKKQTWSKASSAELPMANLFAQVDGGW